MVCFRCDGKGQYKNEFGLMERCESCQGADMTFEKVDDQVSNDQWDRKKRGKEMTDENECAIGSFGGIEECHSRN